MASHSRQQTILRRGVIADFDGWADDSGRASPFGHVGQEHRGTRVDESGVEFLVLTGGTGQVPRVDQHIHEGPGHCLRDGPFEAERQMQT